MLRRNKPVRSSARANVRIAEARLRVAKKALREAELAAEDNATKFFRFDPNDDELLRITYTDELLSEGDRLDGVWFEDVDQAAERAGYPVKTMSQITRRDPDAEFGYALGTGELYIYDAEGYLANC